VVTLAVGSQAPASPALLLDDALELAVDVLDVPTVLDVVIVLVVVTTPPSGNVDVPVVVVVTFVTEAVVDDVDDAMVPPELLLSPPLPLSPLGEFVPQPAAKIRIMTVRAASKRIRMTNSSRFLRVPGADARDVPMAPAVQNLAPALHRHRFQRSTPPWSNILSDLVLPRRRCTRQGRGRARSE
jgi:hypothetical protein